VRLLPLKNNSLTFYGISGGSASIYKCHIMYEKLYFGSPGPYKQFAREMRKNMTEAESILWEKLRHKKLKNYKFRRQHAIGDYIVDFYCPEKAIIIEVDGGIHKVPDQCRYDQIRTSYLEELGLRVIRVQNEEVMNNLTETLSKILASMEQ
jgi:5-methyltetrahydrofolate--homocysteine methyltransferase